MDPLDNLIMSTIQDLSVQSPVLSTGALGTWFRPTGRGGKDSCICGICGICRNFINSIEIALDYAQAIRL